MELTATILAMLFAAIHATPIEPRPDGNIAERSFRTEIGGGDPLPLVLWDFATDALKDTSICDSPGKGNCALVLHAYSDPVSKIEEASVFNGDCMNIQPNGTYRVLSVRAGYSADLITTYDSGTHVYFGANTFAEGDITGITFQYVNEKKEKSYFDESSCGGIRTKKDVPGTWRQCNFSCA